MLAKKIKYKNFNGEEREKTFYFHLNKVEVAEMEVSESGGIEVFLQRIVEEQDNAKILEYFKEFVLLSDGRNSDDGERFEKGPEVAKAFEQSPAFEVLFMELATDADAAAVFVSGVLPEFDDPPKEKAPAKQG